MRTLGKAIFIPIFGLAFYLASPAAFANGPSTGLEDKLNTDAIPQMQEEVEAIPSKEIIKNAQKELKHKGFFKGVASGELDSNTLKAIKKFQKHEKIDVTGKLDKPTLKALEKMAE